MKAEFTLENQEEYANQKYLNISVDEENGIDKYGSPLVKVTIDHLSVIIRSSDLRKIIEVLV